MKREQVLPHVMADMAARIAKGADEYGEPLTTFNGRDALQDSYEEALDLALYLKQELLERVVSDALHDGLGVFRVNGDGTVNHVTQEEFRAPDWPGPDWSQAPEWAMWWCEISRHYYWLESRPYIYKQDRWSNPVDCLSSEAPSFNYQGHWRDSLRKRPE